jgi:hypothetical protein
MHMDMLIDLHTSRPYFEVFQFRIQVIQKIEQEVQHNITGKANKGHAKPCMIRIYGLQ